MDQVFTAKMLLIAQVRRERDHTNCCPRKQLVHTDETATSLHLSPTTAPQSFYLTEPLAHDITRSKLAISHTFYCRYYILATEMLYNKGTVLNRVSLLLDKKVDVNDEDFSTHCVTSIYR